MRETDKQREALARIAVCQAVSGLICPVCSHEFTDYDDIKSRDPRKGYDGEAVCDVCWEEYEKGRNQTK